ncbi:MAG: ABC transporter permease subunit [Candidatus Humimicrobiaceae bacterium]
MPKGHTNPTVAFLSGINVKNVKVAAYCISSLSAAIGGIIMTGKIVQSYLGMGDYVMFQTIAAVVVGGTLLTGGKGSYIGTVAGAFILTILTGLLSAFRMPSSTQ